MTDTLRAWWFSAAATLPNDDGRPVVLGETLTVDPAKVVPCKFGLHASASAIEALRYAPGPILWRVELGGKIVPHGDPVNKYAASERTAIAGGIDVSPLLWEFARKCALDVIHLWDAPQVVRDYLTTGDESLRDAARAAAGAAAWDAARDAARAAAWDAARAAAWAAAGNAAWAAARAAAGAAAGAAAWDAARDAARAAARDEQRERFELLCLTAVGEELPR